MLLTDYGNISVDQSHRSWCGLYIFFCNVAMIYKLPWPPWQVHVWGSAEFFPRQKQLVIVNNLCQTLWRSYFRISINIWDAPSNFYKQRGIMDRLNSSMHDQKINIYIFHPQKNANHLNKWYACWTLKAHYNLKITPEKTCCLRLIISCLDLFGRVSSLAQNKLFRVVFFSP